MRAELLAQGRIPSATALIDEAFRLADEGAPGKPGYRALAGRPFPLKGVGRHAVAMRLEDRNWLNPDEFAAETPCLLDQKLLISRAVKGAAGLVDRLMFRHERVWDFFIAAAFSDDPDLWEAHVTDPRFRGAYFRIAETWDPESAKRVRDALNLGAAEFGRPFDERRVHQAAGETASIGKGRRRAQGRAEVALTPARRALRRSASAVAAVNHDLRNRNIWLL